MGSSDVTIGSFIHTFSPHVNEEEDLLTTIGPYKRSQDWIRVTHRRETVLMREKRVVDKRIMVYLKTRHFLSIIGLSNSWPVKIL